MPKATGQYKCYFKPAPSDDKFKVEFKHELVNSIDRFVDLTRDVKGQVVAVDTETRSLDHSLPKPVVGFSFSFSPYDGFYVPVRHLLGQNVPEQVFPLLNDFMLRNQILFYNAPFDMLMLKQEGLKVFDFKMFEVMVLVFNADTNIKHNSLKWAASHYLGRESPTYQEVLGKKTNVQELSPEDLSYYACCDTANTFGLFRRLYPFLKKECLQTLKIDNELSKIFPHYLTSPITIDSPVMAEMVSLVKKKIRTLEREVFSTVGYPFPLDSKAQLSTALLSIGVDTGARTKQGNMKLGEEELKMVDHPIAKQVVERNSLVKQLGSYLEKLSKVSTGYVNYFLFRVPTGRTASGNKDNPFFLKLNFQNLTKPVPAYFRATYTEKETPDSVFGFSFEEVAKDEMKNDPEGYFVEGFSPDMNVRRAITVPSRDEFYYVGVDYSQEELYLAGAFSNDPVMMQAFRTGEDLHKITAHSMFGQENYDKERRRKAKIAAFGLLYGGNAYTIHKSSGLPLSECEDIYNKYWQTMKVLRRWRRQQISMCYRTGVARTAYGRPRRLSHYLSSPNTRIRMYGERSVISHIIQGTGGDVIRKGLIELHKNLFSKYPNDVKFIGIVHDEYDLAIRKSVFKEMIEEVREVTEIHVPGTELPLKVDFEIGFSYGEMWPFEKNEAGNWEPVPA